MTVEEIALASRAVACRAWRWMPGMLTTDGFRICRVDADGYKFGYLTEYSYAHTVDGDVLPDLQDHATLGCLLALVREAHGKPAVPMFWGDYWQIVYTSEVDDGCAGHEHIGDGDTEIEALVAALEAAP